MILFFYCRFVGPPFHATPFAEHINYAATSVFLNISGQLPWWPEHGAPAQSSFRPTVSAVDRLGPRWCGIKAYQA